MEDKLHCCEGIIGYSIGSDSGQAKGLTKLLEIIFGWGPAEVLWIVLNRIAEVLDVHELDPHFPRLSGLLMLWWSNWLGIEDFVEVY